MARIATFDDWSDIFFEWRKEIGVDHPLITKYTFDAKYGDLSTNENTAARDRGTAIPVLQVNGDAELVVFGSLRMIGSTFIQVQSSQPVILSGNLENRLTNSLNFDWESGLLTLNGTDQKFEVAGEDRGADSSGFTDNWVIDTLRIEPGVVVRLTDDYDNSTGTGAEALYVRSISLGAGSILYLNGMNVFYDTLIDEGGTIDDSAGGSFVQTAAPPDCACGNFDGNSQVNLNDFATFAGCFNTPPVGPCACSDLTGDGVINLNDFATFAGLFNQPWNGQSPPNCL